MWQLGAGPGRRESFGARRDDDQSRSVRHVGAQPALGGDEHQDAQDQEQADRVGGGLLKDLRVRSLRIHGGRGDRQVLRGHDLADAAADGVGGQQDVRVEAGARGGGGLQVREESARRGRGAGDGRSDPAQDGGEEREGRARRRQGGADRGGLAGEVHDEGESHHGGNRQDRHAQRVDGARQDCEHLTDRGLEAPVRGVRAVHDGDDDAGDKDPGAGVGQDLQRVDRSGRGRSVAGQQVAVDAGPRDLHVRGREESCDGLGQLRDRDDDDDEDVGQQGQADTRAGGLVGLVGLGCALRGGGRTPEEKEDVAGGEAEQGGDDGGQLVGNRGGEEVARTGSKAGDEGKGPQLAHAAGAVEDEEHQHRDEQTEDPRQVAHVAGNDNRVGATELTGGRGGNGHGAEANVDGVADDGDDGGLDLGHAEGHEHRTGDGHGSAEAGQALEQATETPGDEEGLGALVAAADRIKHGLEVRAAPRLFGEVVEPHGRDDDVDDRHEAHRRALRAGQERHADGHLEGKDRDDERGDEGDDRAPVGGDLEDAHEDEEEDEGEEANDGRQENVARDGRRRRGKRLG